MFNDLGILEELVEENLQFIGEKILDYIECFMFVEFVVQWFGVVLLDLILVVCVCGVDWIYIYLCFFYVDELCLFGVNNMVFLEVGMLYVL